jgi:hypothetical protein
LLREERTDEENELLEKIADGIGVAMPMFQKILQDAQRRIEDRRNGGISVAVEGVAGTLTVEVLEEDDCTHEKGRRQEWHCECG